MGKSRIYMTTSGDLAMPIEVYAAFGIAGIILAVVVGVPALYLYVVGKVFLEIVKKDRAYPKLVPVMAIAWLVLNMFVVQEGVKYAQDKFFSSSSTESQYDGPAGFRERADILRDSDGGACFTSLGGPHSGSIVCYNASDSEPLVA